MDVIVIINKLEYYLGSQIIKLISYIMFLGFKCATNKLLRFSLLKIVLYHTFLLKNYLVVLVIEISRLLVLKAKYVFRMLVLDLANIQKIIF